MYSGERMSRRGPLAGGDVLELTPPLEKPVVAGVNGALDRIPLSGSTSSGARRRTRVLAAGSGAPHISQQRAFLEML